MITSDHILFYTGVEIWKFKGRRITGADDINKLRDLFRT